MSSTSERATEICLPDATAVLVAVWRGMHLRLDAPPYVFVDDVGIRLADAADALGTLGIAWAPDAGWHAAPQFSGPFGAPARPLMVGRARLTEDLLDAAVGGRGLDQYVILGAGLDSLALRRPDLLAGLTLYEIDQPGAQRWKRDRLAALGYAVPERMRFVPVDFEAGDDWTVRLAEAGLDASRPTFLAALGLTQYISKASTAELLAKVAGLGPDPVLVATFLVPEDLVDEAERAHVAQVAAAVTAMGCPWVARFAPEEIADLARAAGFADVRCLSPADLTARYFGGRSDGLRMPTLEHILVAGPVDL